MVTNSNEQLDFHFETLPRETKKALDFLSTKDWLKDSPWYLAGGTALALHAGNRKSFDLDFFSTEKSFENADVLREFISVKEWVTTSDRKNTIYGELFKAKVSFIAYPFFILKQKPKIYGSIKIISPLDISVMKILAISQRGKKRDFFDLYWCAHNIDTLENIVRKLPEQYPSVAHDFQHILKALVYYEDAEGDPNPEIFFDANWQKIKTFFNKEIPLIMKRVVGLKDKE